LHHKVTGQGELLDVGLIDKRLGDDQVIGVQLELTGKLLEGVELMYVAFYGKHSLSFLDPGFGGRRTPFVTLIIKHKSFNLQTILRLVAILAIDYAFFKLF